MIEFILGFLTAAACYGIIKLISGHKHEYDVLFHRRISSVGMVYHFRKYLSDPAGFKPDSDLIYVTYKKCKICNDVIISIGDGSPRDYFYDEQYVQNKIEAIMKIERKEEDEKILKSVDDKLDEKYNTPLVLKNQKEMVLNNA